MSLVVMPVEETAQERAMDAYSWGWTPHDPLWPCILEGLFGDLRDSFSAPEAEVKKANNKIFVRIQPFFLRPKILGEIVEEFERHPCGQVCQLHLLKQLSRKYQQILYAQHYPESEEILCYAQQFPSSHEKMEAMMALSQAR